jgi:hypothetical protein
MLDPFEIVGLDRGIGLAAQFPGESRRGTFSVAEHQNMSGQSVDEQWFSPPAARASKSDDVARTGPRHGGKVRGRSRAEEIRHIVIEFEDTKPRIANRREPRKTISGRGPLLRA